MYQMVRYGVLTSQTQDRLLEAAVQQALNKRIVDLGLREIALVIGTNYRMLINHFGSREGLTVAVDREVKRHERQTLAAADVPSLPG